MVPLLASVTVTHTTLSHYLTSYLPDSQGQKPYFQRITIINSNPIATSISASQCSNVIGLTARDAKYHPTHPTDPAPIQAGAG